jgi:2-oxoglutarate ferredoxin oxidoreductase subunit gamma
MRHEIIMAGFGGQGIMLMGQILATAAMIENQDVVWHPSYGPEMRGGTAYCTVVLSDSGLGSPVASAFDSAVIMDAPSLGKFLGKIKPGGLLILNTSLVTVPEPAPAGLRVVPDLAMLGAFVEVTKLVATESIPAALRCIIPERRHNLLPLNQRAFDEGARAVRGG